MSKFSAEGEQENLDRSALDRLPSPINTSNMAEEENHRQQQQQQQQQMHGRDLVIHGEPVVDSTRYPYFTLVGEYCGGSLIAPDIVLTAGHCKINRRDGGHHEHIRIGMASRYRHHRTRDNNGVDGGEGGGDDDDDDGDLIHHSVHQVRHPDYDWRGDDEFSNDILIIQLDIPSDKPFIHLEKEPIHASAVVLAMGMGWTKKDEPSWSNHLRSVWLDTIDNDSCSQASGRDMSYDGRIDDSMMCTTGGEHNERDTWYVMAAAS
jgi:Trypsin